MSDELRERLQLLKEEARKAKQVTSAMKMFKFRKANGVGRLGIGDANPISPFQLGRADKVIDAMNLARRGELSIPEFGEIVKTYEQGIVDENRDFRNDAGMLVPEIEE